MAINYVKSVAVFTETKGPTRLWITYVGVLMVARTVLLYNYRMTPT